MDAVPDPTASARTDASARGLTIDVRERPQADTLEDAATQLGLEPAGLVKSLVVRRGAGDYLFALLPLNRSLSWPLLRAAAGTNRMTLPDADEAYAATGYVRGTICPIGSTQPWPVFIDAAIPERISLGSGSHQHAILVHVADLVNAYDATVVPLSN